MFLESIGLLFLLLEMIYFVVVFVDMFLAVYYFLSMMSMI